MFAIGKPDYEDDISQSGRLSRFLKRWRYRVAFTAFSLTSVVTPFAAHASAPVMALPKAEQRDPATDALMERERRQTMEAQRDLQRMAQQAREIEATQGEAARQRFEKEYYRQKEEAAVAKKEGLEKLKIDLLKQGIDPFTDIEGQRQIVLYEKGVDLADVTGTPFNLEKELERRSPKKTVAFQKAPHRKIIACMVEELINRGEDPIEYFQKHQDKTSKIMDLPYEKAVLLAQMYSSNLEEYGQVRKPAEGEKSVKEMMVKDPAQIKAEKKAMAEAEKKKAKKDKEAAKEKAKAEKESKKVQTLVENQKVSAAPEVATDTSEIPVESNDVEQPTFSDDARNTETPLTPQASAPKANSPIVPVTATVVTVGGGGYAIKVLRDKRAAAEAERQRQFKLLIGGDENDDEDENHDADLEYGAATSQVSSKKKTSKATDSVKKEVPTFEANESPAPKKRRLGIKNVFGKKGSGRETDLNALIGPSASYPEFSSLLAKILTYGAPGRFPDVIKLPGGMPMDDFDLEKAKQLLTEARESAGLEIKESAEIFANVVNCMLIEIVDLASSSLKEKKDDATVKSINIVVDFMNHAASLYDSVAKDVVINPVVYEGDLSKSKLEQMYSTYTVSGMMGMFGGGEGGTNMSDDFDSRVALLQDVFQISEKKAEGLMMKAVQKNMMEMMKEGKRLEGMEDMLKGLEGMDGLAGLMGEDGEGPSPEQLKEMLVSLKQMKDSGSIPPKEFDEVKKQFKEAFGSSLDDVVKDASRDGELSDTEKELLDLMKAIMDD